MKLTVLIVGVFVIATELHLSCNLVASEVSYEDNNNYANTNEAKNYDYLYKTNDYDEGKYYFTKRSDYSGRFIVIAKTLDAHWIKTNVILLRRDIFSTQFFAYRLRYRYYLE